MPPTPRTPAEIGRANMSRGKIAERQVVGYYRDHGFPGAERTVRTGARTGRRTRADHGDIDGTPGLCTQVKVTLNASAEAKVPEWLAQTEAQRRASGADLGVLVVKRVGAANPGRWWAYLPLPELIGLIFASQCRPVAGTVRLELASLVELLRAAGYGTPPEVTP